MITYGDLNSFLQEGVRRWDIDLDMVNDDIERYRPVVTQYDLNDSWVSVLVEDMNANGVPPLWIDYWISHGDIDSEWNKFEFHNWNDDVVLGVYMSDHSVWEKADGVAFDFLFDRGILTSADTRGGIAFNPSSVPMGIYSARTRAVKKGGRR